MPCRFANAWGYCRKTCEEQGFDTYGTVSTIGDDGLPGIGKALYHNDMSEGKNCWGWDESCPKYEAGLPVFYCGKCQVKFYGFPSECPRCKLPLLWRKELLQKEN